MTTKSILGKLATHLGRENWSGAGAEALAEEIIKFAGSESPIEITEPIKITRGYEGPVFEIVDSSELTGGLSSITTRQGDVAEVAADTSGGTSASGTDVNYPGLYGTVQSGGPGSGPYTVTLHGGTSVQVTQIDIDSAATVPAGAVTPVFKTNTGTYFMQVPVWGS